MTRIDEQGGCPMCVRLQQQLDAASILTGDGFFQSLHAVLDEKGSPRKSVDGNITYGLLDRIQLIPQLIPAAHPPHEEADAPLAETPEADLVRRFAAALLAKLDRSEEKYGWQRAWMRPDWADDLNRHLHQHIAKGDPIDVAAYCAFAWHHGWPLATLPAGAPLVEVERLNLEWRDGAPPKPWSEEWFIALTTYGDRVVLRALPDEYTYDFKTADETYIKREKIAKWMQFPDSGYIAPAATLPAGAPLVEVEQHESLQPVRQDSFGHSGPRSSSTSWFPLGRWVVNFTNELGRKIHVAVTNSKPDAVLIEMVGPGSTSTNRITRIEAIALRNALNAALSTPAPIVEGEVERLRKALRSCEASLTEAVRDHPAWAGRCDHEALDQARAALSFDAPGPEGKGGAPAPRVKPVTPAEVHASHDMRDEGLLVTDPFCQRCEAGAFAHPGRLTAPCSPIRPVPASAPSTPAPIVEGEVEAYRKALEPFARIGANLTTEGGWAGADALEISHGFNVIDRLTVADFRLAALSFDARLPVGPAREVQR